jgi:hypothetical protein
MQLAMIDLQRKSEGNIKNMGETGLPFPRNTHPIKNRVNHPRHQRQVIDAQLFRFGNGGVKILNRQIVEDLLHPSDRALQSIGQETAK